MNQLFVMEGLSLPLTFPDKGFGEYSGGTYQVSVNYADRSVIIGGSPVSEEITDWVFRQKEVANHPFAPRQKN